MFALFLEATNVKTTVTGIALALIGYGIVSGIDFKRINEGNQVRAARATIQSEHRKQREDARAAQKESAVAMERLRAGVVLVRSVDSGSIATFSEGQLVVDPETKTPLGAGIYVGNEKYWTGVTDRNSRISQVARVSLSDLPEAAKLMKQIKQLEGVE